MAVLQKRKKNVGKDVKIWNPCTLLVRMANGSAIVIKKKFLWYLKKLNIEHMIKQFPLLGMYVPWRIKSKNLNRYLYASFTRALFITDLGKQLKCPSTGEWLKWHACMQWSTV